jgi:SAM-dependent MidA family methyltransferase
VVIANEVLDAMPVELVQWQEGGQIAQGGVCVGADGRLALAFRPVRDPALRARAAALPVAAPYQSEIGDAAAAFVRTLAGHVARGACFFIDYGFARREFYHPERAQGTLMCHYRHRAHTDPLLWPGLQDITAHVDFSAIAEAAREGGMTVSGYCSQANFLINCGITGELARLDPAQAARYLPAANAVQRLLSPAEMGELFKVIGLSRGIDFEPVGFARGNRAGSL